MSGWFLDDDDDQVEAPAPKLPPELPEASPEPEAAPEPAAPAPPPGPAVAYPSTTAAAAPGPAENDYTLILGAKGRGKTTMAREIFRHRIAAGGSGVWIDRTGRNADLAGGKGAPGFCTTPGAAARHIIGQVRAGCPFACVVALGWGASHDKLWRLIYEVGDCLVVLDEAGDLANAHRIEPDLYELVSKGRNAQVDMVTTTRTPPELHKQIRGNADVVISFGQVDTAYARQLNDEFFLLDDGVDRLLRLPPFYYLRRDVRRGTVTGGVLVPPWER